MSPAAKRNFLQTLNEELFSVGRLYLDVARNPSLLAKGMYYVAKDIVYELPKSLIDMEIERLRDMARQDLAARGIPVRDDMPLPVDLFEKQAQRRVSLGLILGEVVRKQSLNARPEQVRAAVEDQAQSYEHPQEVVKWIYQSQERLRDIESMVLEENVVTWALATARVEDKAITFDELMGNAK